MEEEEHALLLLLVDHLGDLMVGLLLGGRAPFPQGGGAPPAATGTGVGAGVGAGASAVTVLDLMVLFCDNMAVL